MIDPNQLNLNTVSPLSAGSRTPISSPGSGGGVQQNPQFGTSTTDLTGAGALVGGLVPLLMQAKNATGAGGQNAQQSAQNKAEQAAKNALLKALTTIKPVTPVGTTGGKPIGGGSTGTVGGLKFPPGTTQANIDAEAPGYKIAGVDMSTGEVIAQPDLMIGGGTLTGDGSIIQKIDPTGSFTTGPMGNIYDPNGDLYAIKSGDKYLVDNKDGTYTDTSTNKTVTADEAFSYTGGGWDPSSSDLSSVISGGGWTPTSDIPTPSSSLDIGSGGWSPESLYTPIDTTGAPNFATDIASTLSLPSIDVTAPAMSGADSFISSLSGNNYNYSPSNWDFGSALSDFASSFNPFDWFGAQGGLASMSTPTMKDGGEVKHFVDGGTTGSTTSSLPDWLTNIFSGINVGNVGLGAGLGALLGSAFGPSSSTVNTGVDMSRVGNIAPRTTTFGMGPANFVPYGMYGVPPQPAGNTYSNLYSNLGVAGYTPPATPTGGLGGMPPRQPDNSFYTYGTHIDPSTILNTGATPMKEGGMSHNDGGSLLGNERRMDYRQGSYVEGPGDGQSDDIPAMLADGEYVIDAETVAQLGNGSNKAGAKILDQFRENIREHKRSAPLNKIPPKSKSPLAYLKGAK